MNKNIFSYKYSAPTKSEREEIEDIRKSYLPKTEEEDTFDRLKKLDKKVKKLPIIISIVIGTIGLLIFGLGMCFVLEWNMLVVGIIISLVGCAIMVANYFVYKKIRGKLKTKYSSEILKLSEKLLNLEKKDVSK